MSASLEGLEIAAILGENDNVPTDQNARTFRDRSITIEKTWNKKACFIVLPVLVLVRFSTFIPLMKVVNYSVQDTFGSNQFLWVGAE